MMQTVNANDTLWLAVHQRLLGSVTAWRDSTKPMTIKEIRDEIRDVVYAGVATMYDAEEAADKIIAEVDKHIDAELKRRGCEVLQNLDDAVNELHRVKSELYTLRGEIAQ